MARPIPLEAPVIKAVFFNIIILNNMKRFVVALLVCVLTLGMGELQAQTKKPATNTSSTAKAKSSKTKKKAREAVNHSKILASANNLHLLSLAGLKTSLFCLLYN